MVTEHRNDATSEFLVDNCGWRSLKEEKNESVSCASQKRNSHLLVISKSFGQEALAIFDDKM